MIDLDAIRRRDQEAEKCAKCGLSISGHREDTLDQCNRRLARQAMRAGRPIHRCDDPAAHHAFVPGGGYDDWNGDEDRHLLLEYIDTRDA